MRSASTRLTASFATMASLPKVHSRLPFFLCLLVFITAVLVFLVTSSLLLSTASNLTTFGGGNLQQSYRPPVVEGVNQASTFTNHNTKSEYSDEGEPSEPPPPIKLGLPVFVTALPKSGTTTTHDYFACGGQRSAHHVNMKCWRHRRKTDPDCFFFLSDCIQHNIQLGKPPLENCGDFDVYSDTGYEDYERCFHPTLSNLETLVATYPNMTLLHVTRNETRWFESIAKYQQATILRHWKNCHSPDGMFPLENPSSETYMNMYRNHTHAVRALAAASPDVTYVEVALEDPDTPSILQEATGIDQACWGQSNTLHDNLIQARQARRKRQKRMSRAANTAS